MLNEMKTYYRSQMQNAAITAIYRYILPSPEYSTQWLIENDDNLVELAREFFPKNHREVVTAICILKNASTLASVMIAIGELIKLSDEFEDLVDEAKNILAYNTNR